MLSRLKREWRVTGLDLAKLDTSRLSVEETIEAVTGFWLSQARI
jgi:hypothetical protein